MSSKLKYPLLAQLYKSLALLKGRRQMIPKYVNQSDHWAGKNHYSLDMLPDLDRNIDEMKAAIQGIEDWKLKLQKEAREERKKSQPSKGLEPLEGSGGKEVQGDTC